MMLGLENNTIDTNKENVDLKHLPPEIIITFHVALSLIPDEEKGKKIIYRDLFDSRKEIVISALKTIGKIKDSKAIGLIGKLINNPDEDIKCEAIKTYGDIGEKSVIPFLINLFKTNQDERLRCSILETLVSLTPENFEVKTLLRAYAASPVISGKTKAFAIGLLLKTDPEFNVEYYLNDQNITEDVLTEIYVKALENDKLIESVCNHGIKKWNRLNPEQKITLIKVGFKSKGKILEEIFSKGLIDFNPEVRRAIYQQLNASEACTTNEDIYKLVTKFMINGAEENVLLEELAISGIRRIANLTKRSLGYINEKPGKYIEENILNLFENLKKTSHRVHSDTHEIGWYIIHAKEYIEFYGDEDFKQGIVNYLKKSRNYSESELLKKLKESATRVEVRHFDGYNALKNLIKKPNRPGAALIARELALAKQGKRQLMDQLIRNLIIGSLFNWNSTRILHEIYQWSKKNKLFHLAEAALEILARIDSKKINPELIENITLPLYSKILTIATLRIFKKFYIKELKTHIIRLFENCDDPLIVTNAINALSNADAELNPELQKAMFTRLKTERSKEVVALIGTVLRSKSSTNIIGDLIKIYWEIEKWKREEILKTIHGIILRNTYKKDLELEEFLYGIMRQNSIECKSWASLILYYIEDDYAIKAMEDAINNGTQKSRIILLENLNNRTIDTKVLSLFLPLFTKTDNILHEHLRELLRNIDNDDTRHFIYNFLYKLRTQGIEDEQQDELYIPTLNTDLAVQKKEYQFEKEYIEKLTVMFTDIEGYTRMSQKLSSIELANLIQEYEGLLIPLLIKHNGKLIKHLGDGHLFIFKNPLDAVIGAIRLKKSLNRFNSYREEKHQITVKIGIHYGDVIRKGEDVLGNTVNISSRLQENAKGGRIYISHSVYSKIGEWIHSREIGNISVKGLEKPLMVYEPYEIAINLPEKLDPTSGKQIKKTENTTTIPGKVNSISDNHYQLEKTYQYIKQSFSILNNMCIKAKNGKIPINLIRKELIRRWKNIQKLLT